MQINQKIFNLLILTFFSIFQKTVNAQNNSWLYSNKSDINWYEKTPTGSIIISTDKNLLAIDPISKQELWQMPQFDKLSKSSFYLNKNFPLITVSIPDTTFTDSSSTKKKVGFFKKMVNDFKAGLKSIGKGGRLPRKLYINYLNGDIVFDTKDAEINYLTSVNYFFNNSTAILQGFNGDTSVLSCLSLTTRKKLWQINRPGVAAKPFFQTPLSISADVNNNFLLSAGDSMYYVSGNDGKRIWTNKKILSHYRVSNIEPYVIGIQYDSLLKVNTNTGKIEQYLVLPDVPGIKKRDALTSNGLFGPAREIFLFDTITVVSSENKFIVIGQTFPAASDCKAYSMSDNFQFHSMKKLPDSSIMAVFKKEDVDAVGIMRFTSNYKGLWGTQIVVPGKNIRSILSHKDVFTVVTDRAYYIAQPNDGGSINTSGARIPKLDSGFLFAENPAGTHLCFYQSGSLYQLEYKTMQVTEILKKTGFKGGDKEDKIPVTLQGLETGWFLAAAQNILLADYSGNITYNQYYNKPGMSNKATKILSFLGGTAAGFIFRNQAGQLTDALYTTNQISTDDYIGTSAMDYYGGGAGSALLAGDLSSKLFGGGNTNKSQLRSIDNSYHLVFGEQEKKPCLFKIDKKTGVIQKVIPMSSKSQVMETDFINQGVFTINEDGETFEYFSLNN